MRLHLSMTAVAAAAALLGACTQAEKAEPEPPVAPAAGEAAAVQPESLDPTNPGDGSVRCPGNKACPEANLRGFHGVAGEEPGVNEAAKPIHLICSGNAQTSDRECPKGYVGRLVLADSLEQQPTVCRNGQSPCQPRSWAIVCPDGKRGCPMLPKF